MDMYVHLCMSLHWTLFFDQKHVPAPFIPFGQLLHGWIHCGQSLLSYVTDNIEDVISKFLYPIMLCVWTDAFHTHNVVLKNSSILNACTLTVGHPDSDHLGNFSYACSVGRKKYKRCIVDQKLVNEINNLIKNRMLVYHCDWDQIICVKENLYIFLCDSPNKSASLQMLSSQNFTYFGYASDVGSTVDGMICCAKYFIHLLMNQLVPGSCHIFDFRRVKYKTKTNFYPPELCNPCKSYA